MSQPTPAVAPLTVAALVSAATTAAGSLYLSLGLELVACPLCFYQRTFALACVGVLAMGVLLGGARPGLLAALSLPLAVAGLAVALWHVRLEVLRKLECPEGVFDLGTAPQQSAIAFLVLTALLLLDVVTSPGERRPVALLAGLALGALFAVGCVTTASPPPPPKPEEYDQPPRMCRPPRPAQT